DSEDPFVRTLLEDRVGRIWFSRETTVIVLSPLPAAADREGLQRLSSLRHGGDLPAIPGDARQFTAADGLAPETIRTLFQSHDGRVWVGSVLGLSEFDDKRFRTYGPAKSLGEVINTIAEDSGANLWIGTDLRGALKVARNGFTSYKAREGLTH